VSGLRWQIWIDIGRTFIDCGAADPAGTVRSCKVLFGGAPRDVIESAAGNGALRLRAARALANGILTGSSMASLRNDSRFEIVGLTHQNLGFAPF
jgi:hypothetical protein